MQFHLLGRAIETSLSEDPDLTVLEDDVGDFYFQSVVAAGANSTPHDPRFASPSNGLALRKQKPSKPGPVKAVYHKSCPLPCFSGTGLVHYPPRPTQGFIAVTGDDSNPSPGPSSSSSRVEGETRHIGAGKSRGGLLIGVMAGGKRDALVEAFGRRGRPDLGVEKMRLGRGGGGTIAAFDDVHVRFKRQPGTTREGCGKGGIARVAPPAFGARELGIRTSMPKGNRWVIGQRMPGVSQSVERDSGFRSNGDGLGDEVYASIEAPVLSVGDARAAARRTFSGIAGQAGVAAPVAAIVGEGAGRVSGVVVGTGRGR